MSSTASKAGRGSGDESRVELVNVCVLHADETKADSTTNDGFDVQHETDDVSMVDTPGQQTVDLKPSPSQVN